MSGHRHHPEPTGWDGPRTVLAAGAVVWRRAPTGIEIVVVHRPRYDDWSLPKGKLEPDESPPAAALREVGEETGVRARLGMTLGEVRYQVLARRKVVRYWAAEAVSIDSTFAATDEVDEVRWISPEEAGQLLTYAQDAELVKRFADVGAPTGTVLLVRHARAGERRQWSGDDDQRPLSSTGRAEAHKLSRMLTLFGPDRVVSAPPLRCLDTVRPLAQELNLPVTIEPLFGERGYAAAPEAAAQRLIALAAQGGVSVVCSQGGAIPGLVATLARASRHDLGVPRDPVPARKASTWLLALRDHTLVAADYYEHPI